MTDLAVWVSAVGPFHELIARSQGRVPLDHPSFATLAIVATTVSNRQFCVAHDVLSSAMRTIKASSGLQTAHYCIVCALIPDRYGPSQPQQPSSFVSVTRG